jgi:divalent metal cation (Fe/Co/Zn/Cd) transporter
VPAQRAYHFGSRLLVEVDIVMDPSTPLKVSHDVGESLQIAIERLETVERAYVHIDYEWTHSPEHKVIVGL